MLLMPNGAMPKKTHPLTADELRWLAVCEDILRKLQLTLACPDCLRSGLREGAVLQGSNDATDSLLTVTCGCKRMVFRQRAD